MNTQARCFINYRRIDGGHAGRLKDRLAARYGSEQLFFDSGSIDCGENISNAIMQGIQSAKVMLVVIGTQWLAALVKNHTENKTDWVKIEIATALKRRNAGESIVIIPVLVGGASMPDVNHLPDAAQEIAGLFSLEALSLGSTDYELEGQFKHLHHLLELYGMPAGLQHTPITATTPSNKKMGFFFRKDRYFFLFFSLLLAFGMITALVFFATSFDDFAEKSTIVPALLLLSAIALMLIIYRLWSDRSIGGLHSKAIGDVFPASSFADERKAFCKTLGDQISKLDRETNWNPEYYAELEAEVEIIDDVGMTLRRRRRDLQSAIRSDRSARAFLVLGDPGAGKSVALRKLTRDMLAEAGKAGRIPIYVNLREWLPDDGKGRRWSEQRKPTMADLESFVLASITRDDSVMGKFVAKYFDKLREHGYLFFIFDSFDEIPQLLDVDGETWLIDSLSDLLYRFIASGQQSRGILASRFFRRPTQSFLAQRILSVKPLTEERILQALSRVPSFGKERQKALFRDRLDLVPIVRNPFLMSLLSEWMQHNSDFPKTQADLYESFLIRCLTQREDMTPNKRLTTEDIFRCAQDIAWFVFNSPSYGLEAPVQVISEAGINQDVDAVMTILRTARVARVTDGEVKSFSFVHRRFLEYFVTKRLLDHPDAAPVEHIPTDSRGRDSLVLYAQLCDDESAKKLALLCWTEIQAHFSEPATRLRAVHCLRFLVDAFGARTMAVNSFVNQLAQFIHRHVAKGEHLVLAKICLEATGLLPHRDSLPIFKNAMESNNSWLQETAFRACRHIAVLSPDLKRVIIEYIATMPTWQFLKNYRQLVFSLSLSESLENAKRLAQFRHLNIKSTLLATPLSIFLMPKIALIAYSWFLFIIAINYTGNLLMHSGSNWKKMSFGELNYSFLHKLSFKNVAIAWQFYLFFLSCVLFIQSENFSNNYISSTADLLTKLGQIQKWMPGIVILLLSTLIADWVLLFISLEISLKAHGIKEMARAIAIKFLELISKYKKDALIITILMLLVVLYEVKKKSIESTIFYEFLKIYEANSELLLKIIGVIFIFRIVFLLWRITNAINHEFNDRRTFRNIEILTKMQRNKIAVSLLSLRSSSWRVKFVRQLAEKKVIAIGEWPSDFQLSVSDDQAITELAILEERWLKLDR